MISLTESKSCKRISQSDENQRTQCGEEICCSSEFQSRWWQACSGFTMFWKSCDTQRRVDLFFESNGKSLSEY